MGYKIDLPDMLSVDIIGESSVLVNGYFYHPGKITGLTYGNNSLGFTTELKPPRIFQLPSSSVDGKFLVNFASNTDIWAVATKNDAFTDRDTILIMRRGNGGDDAPWDHIRNQQISTTGDLLPPRNFFPIFLPMFRFNLQNLWCHWESLEDGSGRRSPYDRRCSSQNLRLTNFRDKMYLCRTRVTALPPDFPRVPRSCRPLLGSGMVYAQFLNF